VFFVLLPFLGEQRLLLTKLVYIELGYWQPPPKVLYDHWTTFTCLPEQQCDNLGGGVA